jgi:hypothetical protein
MKNRSDNMNKTTIFAIPALVMACAALSACSGGSGGGATDVGVGNPTTPVATPAAVKLADAQGFWSATLSATSSASAVILPNGQAWVVYQTGSTITALAQATLSLNGTTYTSSGKYYSLPAGAVQDYSFSGNLIAGSPGTLANSVTVGSGTPTAVIWTYSKTYETPAVQGSVQGRWSGQQGADSLLWDIDAAGKLAGTSTTGCTYSGSITPNANPVAVLDVALTENCAGASKTLSGIATLNAAKTGMSLAYTTGAGAQGGVVVLGK